MKIKIHRVLVIKPNKKQQYKTFPPFSVPHKENSAMENAQEKSLQYIQVKTRCKETLLKPPSIK